MVAAMELEILGMNFGCVLAALADAKIPDKDCLLPLISKLLGYAIVAASTTVKLPQSTNSSSYFLGSSLESFPCSENSSFSVLNTRLAGWTLTANMISALPMLCYGITASAVQSQSVHKITSSTSPASASFKLSRDPSSLMVCSPQIQAVRIQSLRGNQNFKVVEMSDGKRRVSGMKLDIMGMTIGCFISCPLDANNLLPFISKILGYSTIAASTIGKLPQILKILKHGSVRGLSVASFELEVVGYTIALAYCIHKGLPFSAYGELAFLLIQAIILVVIIYYYSPPMGTKTWMKALLYCGMAPTVLAGKIDPALFEVLYASQHAIFFFARVPQIWKNFTNKGTGELSFLTCFMNCAGSIVRVFTSIQEKTPLSVIMGSAIGIIMNGTLLGQILVYQKSAPKKQKKED